MNNRQILRHIARICLIHPKKMSQLETVQSISCNCTSDDAITIESELYNDNICRILITGTRSRMTMTFNTLTMEIKRKKRGEIPWYKDDFYANCSDIFNMVDEIIMFPGGK